MNFCHPVLPFFATSLLSLGYSDITYGILKSLSSFGYGLDCTFQLRALSVLEIIITLFSSGFSCTTKRFLICTLISLKLFLYTITTILLNAWFIIAFSRPFYCFLAYLCYIPKLHVPIVFRVCFYEYAICNTTKL